MLAAARDRMPRKFAILLVLAPFVLVAPFAIVLASPVLGVLAVAALAFAVAHLAWREKEPDGPVDVLELAGLEHEPELETALRADLDVAFARTPREADPAACFCLKHAHGGGLVGTLRTRTLEGHTCETYSGATAAEVVGQARADLARYAEDPPARVRAVPETAICTCESCHLGRRSPFYIDRDDHGRPRATDPFA
ncbi:MAG: hypothetical protein H6745_25860 [Deltaproteobacteria bacterium]|nr:hypothetical protein [Deltaproteobacteria bacterium]